MTALSCGLPGAFAQVRVTLAVDRSRRATLPINNSWISRQTRKGLCFAISSRFAQRGIWAVEMWLLVEVLGWTPPQRGLGAGEVDRPTCLRVRGQ